MEEVRHGICMNASRLRSCSGNEMRVLEFLWSLGSLAIQRDHGRMDHTVSTISGMDSHSAEREHCAAFRHSLYVKAWILHFVSATRFGITRAL